MDLFKNFLGSDIVILGHHNADPDAIGAAVGVKELVRALNPTSRVEVLMPKDISILSSRIIDKLQLDVLEDFDEYFDTVILVDTGSLNQLGDWQHKITNAKNLLVIDHHSKNDEVESIANYYLIDSDTSSTSELVYRLMNEVGHPPSSRVSKALLAGIMFDTKFFSIGSSSTYEAVSKLLEIIGDISQVRDLFNTTYPTPEKIARIKAAQRMEFVRVSNWVIGFSELGSYQSSGARALIGLGADVSVVSGTEKKETRSSLRSTSHFYESTKIHLGDLVSGISNELDGEGSGHPTAAGFNGTCSIDELHGKIKEKLSTLIR